MSDTETSKKVGTRTSTTFKNVTRKSISWLLTFGESLTIGLLSFAGIYLILGTLIPASPFIIPIAITSFLLATVYEGTILEVNIGGAFKKLFGKDHSKRFLANQLLLDLVKEYIDGKGNSRPDCECEFLEIYYEKMCEYDKYDRAHLREEFQEKKQQCADELEHLEALFTQIMFSSQSRTGLSDFEKQIFNIVDRPKPTKTKFYNGEGEHCGTIINEGRPWLEQLKHDYWYRKWGNRLILLFCIIVGIASTVGTAILLTQIIPLLSVLATIPLSATVIFIFIAAPISGLASMFLTYNSFSDLIEQRYFQKSYQKIVGLFKGNGKSSWKHVGKIAAHLMGILFFVALAGVLTFLFGGTWWMVAADVTPVLHYLKHAAPAVFNVLVFIPLIAFRLVLGVVLAASELIFTVANVIETFAHFFYKEKTEHHHAKKHSKRETSWGQKLNLFAAIYRVKFILRYVLFGGHLASTGVEGAPGLSSPIVAATLVTLGELFTDYHYFIKHEHEDDDRKVLTNHNPVSHRENNEAHSHSHDKDLPSRFLNVFFFPLAVVSIVWDWAFSNADEEALKAKGSSAWKEACKEVDDPNVGILAAALLWTVSKVLVFSKTRKPYTWDEACHICVPSCEEKDPYQLVDTVNETNVACHTGHEPVTAPRESRPELNSTWEIEQQRIAMDNSIREQRDKLSTKGLIATDHQDDFTGLDLAALQKERNRKQITELKVKVFNYILKMLAASDNPTETLRELLEKHYAGQADSNKVTLIDILQVQRSPLFFRTKQSASVQRIMAVKDEFIPPQSNGIAAC